MKLFLTCLLLALLVFGTFADVEIGEVAPDFTLPDVRTGEEVTLSDFRGQVVVLQMWKNN